MSTGSVLTANRLRDGVVLFLGREGWVETLAAAEVAAEAADLARLEVLGRQAMAANEVVDAYPVKVRQENGAWRAVELREHLRSLGPSVRPDLGKQARLEAVRVSL